MCFPFYKDLLGIISWNKPDKYLRSWYQYLLHIYAIHAPTKIINQSYEHLRFTFTKKNFTILFIIFFHFFYNLLGVEIALWAEYPPPRLHPPKKKNLSLVVVIKEVIEIMGRSEAEGDLVLIQTFLLYYVNQVILMLTIIFQEQFP